MKPLPLRRYDAVCSAIALVCRCWEMLGIPVKMGSPPPGAVLALAVTESGNKLLVDLRAWFGHSLPEKNGVHADLFTPDDIRDLFHYSGASLSLALPGAGELPLLISIPQNATDYRDHAFPVVDTSCGNGWLLHIEKDYRYHICRSLPSLAQGRIPLRLDFLLGSSSLSLRYLKGLKPGDILLINNSTESVLIDDNVVATFTRQGDNIMLKDIYDDDDTDTERLPHLHELQSFQQNRKGIHNIPVQLTFVIHQINMTLDELSMLHAGDTLAAGDGGENSIKIYANGSLLAKGELVAVNERLGVEIQTLYSDTQYD